MKRALTVFSCLVVLSSCSEDGPVDAGPPPVVKPVKPVVAQLSGLEGPVMLTRDGARAAATPGPAYEGDLLETGAGGHALLKGQGREVELLENSQFRVGKSLAELSLTMGELLFEEVDGGEFATAAGALRTGAGSRVRLEASDAGTSFVVTMGSLELLDVTDGGVSEVKEGQRLRVSMGSLELEELAPPKPPPAPEKPKLKLTPRGAVTLKPKSGAAARVPAAGRELDEPGTFTVEKAAQLRAEAAGAAVELEGGAKGTVEPSVADARFGVTLAAGAGRLFLKEGESVLLGGKRPLRVRAKSDATVLVTPTKDGPRVEVLGGEAEVGGEGGAPASLGSGDVATAKGKGVDKGRRGGATLSLAAGKSTRVYWGRPRDVALQFPEGDGALEVSTDPKFETLLVAAKGPGPLTVQAPLRGSLFWRRQGDAEPSSARFDRDESASAAGAKTDTVAETGLKATVIFQSAVPTLTFTFPPKDGAASWRFRVYATSDLKTPLVDRRVTENRTVVESGTLKEGNYVWSAIAMDRNGVETPGGRMNKMDVVFDNSVTRLVLTAPREGERASTATGLAPLGSRLSMNGKAVPLDAAGRFSVPTGGATVLVFRLVTRDGAESQWVRRLGR